MKLKTYILAVSLLVSAFIGISPNKLIAITATNVYEKQEVKESYQTVLATVTSYSAVESCHYAGCLMASGKKAYVGAVACPRLYKLGAVVKIQGKTFTCEDRTAKRFDGRFDIFQGYGQEAYQKALQWGKRTVQVFIFP